ncbi:MAG TPA: glycerol-3-phosphate 1-O-acyltransferase PlsY [Ktedonobacteraceae bacterium]|nr:glycerol-3-phosphate 1-O-acyltransferase PlsY [Ktedonobacteraceae bacterium]
MAIIQLLLIAIIGYLWGSIPAGYWMGKLLRGKDFDIRAYGSHKIGATNVLRTLGKAPAAIVLVFDLSKGVGPTLLASLVPFFYGSGWGPTVAGLAALIGHCYPVFIGFRGGRGVLTGAGGLLVISPLTFIIDLVVTFSTIAISRFVSLGSIVGSLTALVCGILFFLIGHFDPTFIGKVSLAQLVFMIVAPALIILFHYDNIGRLLAGTERKIGQKVNTEENNSAHDGTSKVQA